MRLSILSSVTLAGLTLAGCPKPTTTASGGSTTPAAAAATTPAKALGDTMADAVLYHQSSTIDASLGCNTSGYAKFDFPVGQAVNMEVAIAGPEGTCVSASYLKANGGNVDGMMKQLCVGKNGNETWDVQGLEGGSFLQVSEAPPCKNATLKVVIQ